MVNRDEIGFVPGSVALHRDPTATRTIYDDIGLLLVERGWVQGAERRAPREVMP